MIPGRTLERVAVQVLQQVRIRFSLGTGILGRVGHGGPPNAAIISWGGSAASSPISRKLMALAAGRAHGPTARR